MLPNCAYCTAAALDDGGGKSSLGRLKGLQRRRASALSPEKSAKRSREEIGALMSKPREPKTHSLCISVRAAERKPHRRCRHRKGARSLTHTSRTNLNETTEGRAGEETREGSFNRKFRLLLEFKNKLESANGAVNRCDDGLLWIHPSGVSGVVWLIDVHRPSCRLSFCCSDNAKTFQQPASREATGRPCRVGRI